MGPRPSRRTTAKSKLESTLQAWSTTKPNINTEPGTDDNSRSTRLKKVINYHEHAMDVDEEDEDGSVFDETGLDSPHTDDEVASEQSMLTESEDNIHPPISNRKRRQNNKKVSKKDLVVMRKNPRVTLKSNRATSQRVPEEALSKSKDSDSEEGRPPTKRSKFSTHKHTAHKTTVLEPVEVVNLHTDTEPASETKDSDDEESSEDSVVKRDPYKYGEGVDTVSKSLAGPQPIIQEQAHKLVEAGFKKVDTQLGGRPLTVATLCAGSESPIIGLNLVRKCLEPLGVNLTYSHIMSAELVPWKQAYIQRNFSPGVIFRDITEFSNPNVNGQQFATTAYGGKAPVPGQVDLLVCGFCCVDFSALNVNKKSLEELGESGDTFHATLAYLKNHEPKIVVLENVVGAPWIDETHLDKQKKKMTGAYKREQKLNNPDLTNAELEVLGEKFKKSIVDNTLKRGIDYHLEEAGYFVAFLKVDSKDYSLPQTRQRGYLVAINKKAFKQSHSENDKIGKMLGEWKQLFKDLGSKVSAPVEQFLAEASEDAGPGLSRIEDADETSKKATPWIKCKAIHQEYREICKLGTGRAITFWRENGFKKLPDFWSPMKGLTERVCDTLDVAHLRNVIRGLDDRFYGRFLELSQNVHRVQDTTKNGIIGCLTPTGIPFWTFGGRRFTGREALTLQGIPVNLLELSNLTEAHLQNFTGNAMSLPVVTAAITAALNVFYRILQGNDGATRLSEPIVEADFDKDHLIRKDIDPTRANRELSVYNAKAGAAITVSLCGCEKRHDMLDKSFRVCTVCTHTGCVDCIGNPRHHYKPILEDHTIHRKIPAEFERLLLDSLPSKTYLGSPSTSEVDGVLQMIGESQETDPSKNVTWEMLKDAYQNALKSEVFLQKVHRGETWEVTYQSDYAKVLLIICGNEVEWRLYAKCSSELGFGNPLRVYLETHPVARLRPVGDDLTNGNWDIWQPKERDIAAIINGNGKLVPSFEASLGLEEFADRYVWDTISITVADDGVNAFEADISGQYELSQDCDQAFNSLHVQSSTKETDTPVYFFFEHQGQRGNPEDHYFVFTHNPRRMKSGESRQTIAQLPASWRQPKIQRVQTADGYKYKFEGSDKIFINKNDVFTKQEVKIRVDGSWISSSMSMSSANETSIIYHQMPAQPPALSNSCEQGFAVLTCEAVIPAEIASRHQKDKWTTVGQHNQSKVFTDFRWMLQSGLLQEDQVESSETWHDTTLHCEDARCQKCSPDRPPILWAFKLQGKGKQKQNKQMPFEDPEKAAVYECALKKRPCAITCMFHVGNDNSTKFQIIANPISLCHKAVFELAPHASTEHISVSWRMITDDGSSPRQDVTNFTIKDNKGEVVHASEYRLPDKIQLRKEQARSVAWQVHQEQHPPCFMEEVIAEERVSKLGYRLWAKASREVRVRGGALLHPVGFGKTAIMLALIHHRRQDDELWARNEEPGSIRLKATLIFMPPALCKQWAKEVTKFLGPQGAGKVLVIQTAAYLKSKSVKDFQQADIIIVNWKILESDSYNANLAQFAGMVDVDSKGSTRSKGVWYQSAFSGVERNVKLLRKDPKGFEASVHEQIREDVAKTNANVLPCPSKRYTGFAYQARKQKPKGRKSDDDTIFEDVVNLKGPSGDYDTMKFVPFEAFTFARILVDEFSYMEEQLCIALKLLKRKFLWVMSATPAMDNFEAVREMATFFRVNLGIVDYTSMPGDVFRKATSDMTDSEKFLIYDTPKSTAWNNHREDRAQQFLYAIARLDLADIDEIPQTSRYELTRSPAAEKGSYIELMQILANNGVDIPRMKFGGSNMDCLLQLVLPGSKTAEEALLKHSTLFNDKVDAKVKPSKHMQSLSPAVSSTFDARNIQFKCSLEQTASLLRKAEWLQRNDETKDCSHYRNFQARVNKITFGDSEVRNKLLEKIQIAKATYRSDHWKEFYNLSTFPKGTIEAQGKLQSARVYELRNCAAKLHSSADELLKRRRSLRFFGNVGTCQRESVSFTNGLTCDKCGANKLHPSAITILCQCGHMACDKRCLPSDEGQCPIEGCCAINMSYQKTPGSTFDGVEPRPMNPRISQKFKDLLSLFYDIPSHEKVLIFVQDEDSIEMLKIALDIGDICYTFLDNSSKSSKELDRFQNGDGNFQVLILNIGTSSAAGCNLTIANHVIFLVPYHTCGSSGQSRWNAAMEQARGRAARFGQKKMVHFYHFLTAGTIEVDIFEHRTGKVIRQGSERNRGVLTDRYAGERAGPFSSPISRLMFGGRYE